MAGLQDYAPGIDFIGDIISLHSGRESQYQAQRFGEREALKQREWQEQMDNTRYQRSTADLQAAGINPMLAYMGGGAHGPGSTPGGATASGGSASYPSRHSLSQNMASAAQVAIFNAQEANIQADTAVKNATEEEIRARIPIHGVSIEKMRQEISESVERIENIRQQVRTGASTAAHLDQLVVNLQATIPQIKASTQQLTTLAKLNTAQAVEVLTRSGLNEAHAKEIKQRLDENLPHMERELHALEIRLREASLPGAINDQAAKDSLIGQMGSYLRTLIPLQGIMGAIPMTRSKTIIQNAPPVNIKLNPGALGARR